MPAKPQGIIFLSEATITPPTSLPLPAKEIPSTTELMSHIPGGCGNHMCYPVVLCALTHWADGSEWIGGAPAWVPAIIATEAKQLSALINTIGRKLNNAEKQPGEAPAMDQFIIAVHVAPI